MGISSSGLVDLGTLRLVNRVLVEEYHPANTASLEISTGLVSTGNSLNMLYRIYIPADGYFDTVPVLRLNGSGQVSWHVWTYIHQASGALTIFYDTPNVSGSDYAGAFNVELYVDQYELVSGN